MGEISHSKVPRTKQKRVGNTKVARKIKNAIEARLKASVQKGANWLEVTLPIHTVSEANGGAKSVRKKDGKVFYSREHWSEQNRRHKLQKGTVYLLLRPQSDAIKPPCVITLTRFAPDKLDRFDNLPMSLKWVLDAVCEVITGDYRPGRADANEAIADVKYLQVVSEEYGVKVRIETTPGEKVA